MDRATLLDHLAQAERHVADGERHILRQEELIAELDRYGHDTAQARALLDTFLATQAQHVEGRDRILKELAE